MEGSASDQRVELRRVRAQAGAASAEMRATLQRAGRQATGSCRPPAAWSTSTPCPGGRAKPGSAWRQGPHRLSAQWDLALRLPANAAGAALAGAGAAPGRQRQPAHPGLGARRRAAGRERGPEALRGRRARQCVAARRVAAGRQPVHRRRPRRPRRQRPDRSLARRTRGRRPGLAGAAGAAVAGAGRTGCRSAAAPPPRWPPTAAGPSMRTEGNARVQQLLAGTLALARRRGPLAHGHWAARNRCRCRSTWPTCSGAARRPATCVPAWAARWPITASRSSARCRWRRRRWPSACSACQAQSGTRAQLLAQRRLAGRPRRRRPLARPRRAAAGRHPGTAARAAPRQRAGEAAAWAEARDLRRRSRRWAPAAACSALRVDPGRLRLADAVALRWDEVRVDLRGGLAADRIARRHRTLRAGPAAGPPAARRRLAGRPEDGRPGGHPRRRALRRRPRLRAHAKATCTWPTSAARS